jgi:hypothetical protein
METSFETTTEKVTFSVGVEDGHIVLRSTIKNTSESSIEYNYTGNWVSFSLVDEYGLSRLEDQLAQQVVISKKVDPEDTVTTSRRVKTVPEAYDDWEFYADREDLETLYDPQEYISRKDNGDSVMFLEQVSVDKEDTTTEFTASAQLSNSQLSRKLTLTFTLRELLDEK